MLTASDNAGLIWVGAISTTQMGRSGVWKMSRQSTSSEGKVCGYGGALVMETALLYPCMKIGQVSFMQMTSPADNPYGAGASGSKYQGQRGPTPSRYFENFR